MSDLFKKNAPRLSEDEERRLWERVRTVPDEVAGERAAERGRSGAGARAGAGGAGTTAGARPWWRGLFAAPAFRFGAPALAVLVAATLFVVQQNPRAPIPGAGRGADEHVGTVETRERALETAPAPEPEPAPGSAMLQVAPEESRDADESAERANGARADQPGAPAVGAKDQQKKTFASEPPSATVGERREEPVVERQRADELRIAAPAAPPPTQAPSKVTVIKGGKESAATPAPGPSSNTAPAAPAPSPTRASKSAEELETKQEDSAASDMFSLEKGKAASEGSASGAAPSVGGVSSRTLRADAATASAWQSIVAGSPHAMRWIEIIPSMFDDGGVVVLAGTNESGMGLYVDDSAFAAGARATPLVRDATSRRSGIAEWVYDRRPRDLSPVIVRLASPKEARTGWTIQRRVSYRDASQEVQIAYLAAEGERTSAISASSTAGPRFDQLALEARALLSRRPTDARLQRLVTALTSARATLR